MYFFDDPPTFGELVAAMEKMMKWMKAKQRTGILPELIDALNYNTD